MCSPLPILPIVRFGSAQSKNWKSLQNDCGTQIGGRKKGKTSSLTEDSRWWGWEIISPIWSAAGERQRPHTCKLVSATRNPSQIELLYYRSLRYHSADASQHPSRRISFADHRTHSKTGRCTTYCLQPQSHNKTFPKPLELVNHKYNWRSSWNSWAIPETMTSSS